jgi:hypothetical protein
MKIGGSESKKKNMPCFNCSGKGHLSRNCPSKEQTAEGKEAHT